MRLAACCGAPFHGSKGRQASAFHVKRGGGRERRRGLRRAGDVRRRPLFSSARPPVRAAFWRFGVRPDRGACAALWRRRLDEQAHTHPASCTVHVVFLWHRTRWRDLWSTFVQFPDASKRLISFSSAGLWS